MNKVFISILICLFAFAPLAVAVDDPVTLSESETVAPKIKPSIKITSVTRKLNNHYKHIYHESIYTIQNNGERSYLVSSVNTNGIETGNQAVEKIKGIRPMASTWTGALIASLFTGGLSLVVAGVASPFIHTMSKIKQANALASAPDYSAKLPPDYVLPANASIELKGLRSIISSTLPSKSKRHKQIQDCITLTLKDTLDGAYHQVNHCELIDSVIKQ